MDFSVKNFSKILAVAGLAALVASNGYAIDNAKLSPLQTQKITIVGLGAVKIADFNPPISFDCVDCVQTIRKNGIYFVNYAVPTSGTEQGKIVYWFYTGDPSNYNTECPYDVTIPFTLDTTGHFSIAQNTYPATLSPDHAPNCEKHAFTRVTTEGDIIHLNNQVME